jgi:hypothetical protein
MPNLWAALFLTWLTCADQVSRVSSHPKIAGGLEPLNWLSEKMQWPGLSGASRGLGKEHGRAPSYDTNMKEGKITLTSCTAEWNACFHGRCSGGQEITSAFVDMWPHVKYVIQVTKSAERLAISSSCSTQKLEITCKCGKTIAISQVCL